MATQLAGISLLLLVTLSCSKTPLDTNRRQSNEVKTVINANLPSGQEYIYNASSGGTISIASQALHFEVSEATVTPGGSSVYKYTPVKGYTGADEVTLRQTTSKISQGGCCSSTEEATYCTTTVNLVTIRFSVGN